ncbi:MAG: 1-acyl-sn-glycerol-3-phosphate acyltransferase [Bacteroidales bacterium]|nr:1-acyl-sn-glycerol-3-phosphate acyltransferase [Bacteroidales bacterium]
MKARFWRFVLKIFGWRFDEGNNLDIRRCVLIMAPHTSVWDFVIGRISLWILGVKSRILIKKEFFKGPMGPLLRHMGGVSIDRGNRHNNVVQQVVQQFHDNEHFTLVVTPEGTRKYTKRWKRGFYDIAMGAGVPIVLTYIDYPKKQSGVWESFIPSGNYEQDIIEIQNHYKNIGAKYPENFNMSRMYWDNDAQKQ